MPDDRRQTLDRLTAASTGQRLLKAARLLDERALERIRAVPGAPPIRPAHTRLFPHLSVEGIRGTAVAARLGISKQAVSALVADLEGWGLVEQVPDPDDGRARLIRWTAHGIDAIQHGLGVLATLENTARAQVDPAQWAGFEAVLDALIDALSDGPAAD